MGVPEIHAWTRVEDSWEARVERGGRDRPVDRGQRIPLRAKGDWLVEGLVERRGSSNIKVRHRRDPQKADQAARHLPPIPGTGLHTAMRRFLRQWKCRLAVGLESAFREPGSKAIAACATADGAEMDEALGDHRRAHREADMGLGFWSCAALCAFQNQRVWTECSISCLPSLSELPETPGIAFSRSGLQPKSLPLWILQPAERKDGPAFKADRRAVPLADSAARRRLHGASYGCCRASDSRSAT